MITVITIEGVLTAGEDLKTAMPTKHARMLYEAFKSQSNIIALTQAPHEIASWWLRREHLTDWSRILVYPATRPYTWSEWRVDFVRELLSDGWEIFAFVDSDPQIVESATALGVTGICVSYPAMPVGWKDVAAPRAWTNIVATVDQTR